MSNLPMSGTPVFLNDCLSTFSYPIDNSVLALDSKAFINVWKKMNAENTIVHIFSKLNELGYISNLRAVRDSSIERRGMWFSDSDVFKSLEAALWASSQDRTLLSRIGYDGIVDVISKAQDPDGYINSWFQISAKELKWKDLASGHEMYTAGHLIQAGIAESRVKGPGALLKVAVNFADLLVEKFSGGTPYASDGHPEIETALIELYRETRNSDYLELSRKMLEGRGLGLVANVNTGRFHPTTPIYIQDHLSVRESERTVGHCVRQMYLNLGVMDLYFESNDLELLKVQEAMWEDVTHTKMYVTGGIGSRHRDESFGDSYELPNDRAYAETCASIGYFMWNWKLLLATGNSRYADLMEILIYNLIAGSVSSDFKRFFYSNPLHRRADHLAAFDEESSERMEWYRVSCCPPNIGRIIGSIDSYAFSEKEDKIFIHQFFSGNFSSNKFATWDISVSTVYPAVNNIEIVINKTSSQDLYVRVPKWAKTLKVMKNGNGIATKLDEQSYLVFSECASGDKIEIFFESDFHYVYPHPLLDSSRGAVAVQKGPILYALDQFPNGNSFEIENCVILLDEIFKEEEEQDDLGVSFSKVIVNGRVLKTDRITSSFQLDRAKLLGTDCLLTLIPYSRWGNPVSGGMRVWIPSVTN